MIQDNFNFARGSGLERKSSRFIIGAVSTACITLFSSNAFADSALEIALSKASDKQVSVSKKAESFPVIQKKVYLGRAPYICTPSGFGKKASCFLRASAN
jgi:hypothetical protein